MEELISVVVPIYNVEKYLQKCMHEKDNYLKTAELSTEQNCNMIDGVPNNTPIPPTPPELDAKPLDKVKEPKERRKGRELER